MDQKTRPVAYSTRVMRYAAALAGAWTTVVVVSLGWTLQRTQQDLLERARMEARGSSDKDLLLQQWAAGHGGVYVPATDQTPPNPNLTHVPERDVVTPSGNRLTLMNAAYMMRQLYAPGTGKHGLRGHFTSLRPIRPANAPDPWERSALEAFERGQKEVSSVATLDGQPYMRLMRPMLTTEQCLKCHAEQGYKAGDVRGGFSVSVSMKPYWGQVPAMVLPLILGHGLIWLLGLAGLGWTARSVRERIAERERAEDERRRLQAQIQHAQKLESLGVLAGGIAHDFNNLLLGVLGNADLALADLTESSAAYGNLLEAKRAATRAADLCRQMLAYSGRGKFVVEAVDLREVVEEMASMLKVSISKRAVLEFRFDPDLPRIEADATQLRQVALNLIVNASEALGDDDGGITVSAGAMECGRDYLRQSCLDDDLPEGRYAYLEVADTGCGMDRQTCQRLFDPFFSTKFTGRGLGMAAVLGIVRSHRGTIHVASQPGRGATIRALFPAATGPLPKRPRPPAPVEDAPGNGTVLVVDDEETVRTLARKMLERAGFTVRTAADGREAVEAFRQAPDEIAAVLLDLTMPHMDGRQTLRELRRIKPGVRVVLSSGYTQQDAAGRFGEDAPDGFIQKPYESAHLIAKVRGVLRAGD